MTTHEVLVAARNGVDRAWLQLGRGSADEPDGHCSAVWINEFAPDVRLDMAACDALADVVGVAGVRGIHGWNDAPGRTKAEVLAAFDAAIARTAPPPPDVPLSEPVLEEVPA